MACIKSAQRSALVAFAPESPYLAAGTMAGAVDLSFSSSANLEIFKLDFQSDGPDLPLVASCPSTERFNRLSWSKPGSGPGDGEYTLGLVAGGLVDGSIGVWNPFKLISSEDQDDAFVARLEKHTGQVLGLEFSALSPNLLASGADEGELCIWDLANPPEPNLFPSLKSTGSGAQTEVSYVSWNPKFQHILASTSYNGMTVVWDLRQQKPVTSFSDRRRCSVLQWNPDISTQLIIASDDDNSPSLRVWDVRKTISPLREFVGHTKGVIAMSWCPYDSSFLLTCAKDNRTICWDTLNGEIVRELPASTNWNFDIHWYPRIPGVIAASSFDVKIGIYNIEACSQYTAGEGFGTPARLRAPKWLKCSTGASFGFGGKFVSFLLSSSAQGAQPCASEVYVHNLVTEHNLVNRSSEFEAAIQNGEKSSLRALCDKKSQDSLSEDDRETWGFLKVMFEEEGTARTQLLAHLGFNVPSEVTEYAPDDLGEKLTKALSFDNSALPGGRDNEFPVDNGDEFFNNPQPSDDSLHCGDDSSINGKQIQEEYKENTVISDPSFDNNIQHALVIGDYKQAVLQCIAANRMADALLIAHMGGPSLWESTRNQYLKNSISPYLKIVSAMVSNDLMALVGTRPLDSWKETLALLCTFAQKDEWTVLCDSLASRLMAVGNTLAATLCYICAGNIDKTVEIWSCGLKNECEGRSYIDLFQDLMEKTIVLAFTTGHRKLSTSLSKLVENYAELLASQGLLTTAMEYLKLLESEESSHELAILRDRIASSAEVEKDTSRNLPYESSTMEPGSFYGVVEHSQHSYQPATFSRKDNSQVQQQQNVPANPYGETYQHSFGSFHGGYQAAPHQQQFPEYNNPATFQPAQTNQMFLPSQAQQTPQQNFVPAASQPAMKTFIPSSLPGLKNAEQYQQPTLGSQLYPGVANPAYQSVPAVSSSHGVGTSQPGNVPGHNFPQSVSATPISRFVPGGNQGFAQRPGLNPVQPSSPTIPSHVQPAAAPPAPPPNVQTVDTSNVSAELRPVITTLIRLFDETSKALGGPQAKLSQKREIEDNSKKIGALFAKLNTGDISANAASKLIQLCRALDGGDFAAAVHLQVVLTTSDWDECNFWLTALKRMIKIRQSIRL